MLSCSRSCDRRRRDPDDSVPAPRTRISCAARRASSRALRSRARGAFPRAQISSVALDLERRASYPARQSDTPVAEDRHQLFTAQADIVTRSRSIRVYPDCGSNISPASNSRPAIAVRSRCWLTGRVRLDDERRAHTRCVHVRKRMPLGARARSMSAQRAWVAFRCSSNRRVRELAGGPALSGFRWRAGHAASPLDYSRATLSRKRPPRGARPVFQRAACRNREDGRSPGILRIGRIPDDKSRPSLAATGRRCVRLFRVSVEVPFPVAGAATQISSTRSSRVAKVTVCARAHALTFFTLLELLVALALLPHPAILFGSLSFASAAGPGEAKGAASKCALPGFPATRSRAGAHACAVRLADPVLGDAPSPLSAPLPPRRARGICVPPRDRRFQGPLVAGAGAHDSRSARLAAPVSGIAERADREDSGASHRLPAGDPVSPRGFEPSWLSLAHSSAAADYAHRCDPGEGPAWPRCSSRRAISRGVVPPWASAADRVKHYPDAPRAPPISIRRAAASRSCSAVIRCCYCDRASASRSAASERSPRQPFRCGGRARCRRRDRPHRLSWWASCWTCGSPGACTSEGWRGPLAVTATDESSRSTSHGELLLTAARCSS